MGFLLDENGNPIIDELGLEIGDSPAEYLVAESVVFGQPVFATPSIIQVHKLVVSGISTSAPTAGSPSIGAFASFSALGVSTQACDVGSPSIGQKHILLSAGVNTEQPSASEPVPALRIFELTSRSLTTGRPTFARPLLLQVHKLVASGISARPPTMEDDPTLNFRSVVTPPHRTSIVIFENRTSTVTAQE